MFYSSAFEYLHKIHINCEIYFNNLFAPVFTKCEFKYQFPNKFQVTGSFHNKKQFFFSNNPAKHLDKMQESVANHREENQQSLHHYPFSYEFIFFNNSNLKIYSTSSKSKSSVNSGNIT